MSNIGGINISTGFDVNAPRPIDDRLVVNTYSELEAYSDVQKYYGLYVYVIDEDAQYRLTADGEWKISTVGIIYGYLTPTEDIGSEGFLYIDLQDCAFYIKIRDEETGVLAWSDPISFRGIGGAKGEKGDKGDKGVTWYTGTAITGGSTVSNALFTSSGVSSALINDLYLNTQTSDIYKCVKAGGTSQARWTYSTSIRGRSSAVYTGTGVYGKRTTEVIFPSSAITMAFVGDIYINTDEAVIYRCTVAGAPAAAKWKFESNLRLSEVAIQATQPTDNVTKIWIKPASEDTNEDIIPYIKDDITSTEDTFSSSKIMQLIDELKAEITQASANYLTMDDLNRLGYKKQVSVTGAPTTPDENTVYYIQP